MPDPYDAVLIVSFGGPEGPDDVVPFLENVLRGKNVPRERLLEVAEHYRAFGGVSPINEQSRNLVAALEGELAANGPDLPVYLGNRNWRPLLPDTLREMADAGVRRAVGFFTSAFSSYSGCRQYRENVAEAQRQVGEHAPRVDKLRMCFNHPAFIEVNAGHAGECLERIPADQRAGALLLFTAHSIPLGMAENCQYEAQLEEAASLVAERLGHANYQLVYQSRSGPPQQPWLEPDVCDYIEQQHTSAGLNHVVILPIGFLSDHMEVVYDLDTEARQLCERLGVGFQRASTVGTHPKFVRMIRDLIVERVSDLPERPAVGQLGPSPDVCANDCCQYTPRRRQES